MRICDWRSGVCSSDLSIPSAGVSSSPLARPLSGAGRSVDTGDDLSGHGRHGTLGQLWSAPVARKSGVWGKSVSVRVGLGGPLIIKTKRHIMYKSPHITFMY